MEASKEPQFHQWLIQLPRKIDTSPEAFPNSLAVALGEHQ
jgi:hypothetical protein